jgi:hypothetical protein
VYGYSTRCAMQDAFIMGDEIMVVFSAEKMRSLGFSALRLIA